MCGIVAAVTRQNSVPVLIDALKRLEYRGYDSAGMAVIDEQGDSVVRRCVGKVGDLERQLQTETLVGSTGIAHTRWATHGGACVKNAHPHRSGNISVVHNGVIENHHQLRCELQAEGYQFASDTDTEVIAHLLHRERSTSTSLLETVGCCIGQLQGAFGLAIIDHNEPDRVVAVRAGSPLVVGRAANGNFVASDRLALASLADRFQYLEEGDIAEIKRDRVTIITAAGLPAEREIVHDVVEYDEAQKGEFEHFMLKEIHEQPAALTRTIRGADCSVQRWEEAFGESPEHFFKPVRAVQIVACGSSHHAAMIARHWFEQAGVQCLVDIASEYRYRRAFVPDSCLLVAISQSGETADTLAALRAASAQPFCGTLTICNVSGSTMTRESERTLFTRARAECGVASTKGFTSQLSALLMLLWAVQRWSAPANSLPTAGQVLASARQIPDCVEAVLACRPTVRRLAHAFLHSPHCLFLGRGVMYPVAREGALKLKEISYIHAQAYPAGELKHGPLALVDGDMPVIVVAPHTREIDKLKSSIEEVRSRGGRLFVFTDAKTGIVAADGVEVVELPAADSWVAPTLYSIPLQLLAYEVALLKGTDIDQPRNLAKSVTVE